MVHIYSHASYVPTLHGTHEKYLRVIALARKSQLPEIVRALEWRAMIISQILQLDPDADFRITCLWDSDGWEVNFNVVPQKNEIMDQLQSALNLKQLIIKLPKSWK